VEGHVPALEAGDQLGAGGQDRAVEDRVGRKQAGLGELVSSRIV
jgi:hypothetical protein